MKSLLVSLLILFFFGCSSKETVPIKIPSNPKIYSLYTLEQFMKRGQLNGTFPKRILVESYTRKHKLQDVDLKFRTPIKWESDSRCSSRDNEVILALGNEHNSIVCHSGDTVYILGSGNNWIEDSVGNDIFYLGEGNDTVKTSSGSDIFIFEENWGHDKIKLSSRSVDTNKIMDYDGSYPWKYSSFIIFGESISRSEIQWNENTLINIKTGDTISLNTRDINILFTNEQNPAIKDNYFIVEQKRVERINLAKISAKSVLVKGKYAYFSRGDSGLYIVNISDLTKPILESRIVVPGRAMSVHIEGNIAYVAQGDYGLAGRRGWVSIIDIKDPKNPKILKNILFGTNIYSLAIQNNILYIPETNFSNKKDRILRIYDVTVPEKPIHLSTTKLQHFSKFITYTNNVVYLSSFQSGMSTYDVENPKVPIKIKQYKKLKHNDWSIKKNKNYIVVNHGDNVASVFKVNNDKKVIPKCDIYTTNQKHIAGLAGIDAISIQGNLLFKAEGKMGVSISDLEVCEVIEIIPFPGYWVSSVYIINDTLVAFNAMENTSRIYNLKDKTIGHSSIRKIIKDKSPKAKNYNNLSKDQLQTLLYKATVRDDINTINQLCTAGANPNKRGHERYSPFGISIQFMHTETIEALLKNGAKPTSRSMIEAAKYNEDVMRLLEKYGGDITATDTNGCPALFYLVHLGSVGMVKHIIEHGVSSKTTCYGGITLIERAKQRNNKKVIHYLESLSNGGYSSIGK